MLTLHRGAGPLARAWNRGARCGMVL